MILYHGSNLEIMEIDFAKCKPYKDGRVKLLWSFLLTNSNVF